MNKEQKALLRKERRFVRGVIIFSAILFVCLLTAGIYAWMQYPIWLESRIRADIECGQYDQALEKTEDLAQRDTAMAEELTCLCRYESACDMLEAGEFDRARSVFLALEDYAAAADMARECDYQKACRLYDDGDYPAAEAIFLTISGHKDAMTRYHMCVYQRARILEDAQDIPGAFVLYRELGDHEDAPQRMRTLAVQITGIEDPQTALNQVLSLSMEELAGQAELTEARKSLRPGVLAVGGRHTVGLKSDGTVLAAGYNGFGQCNVADWSHVIMVDAGALHTVALRDNGTVTAAGSNEFGQCNVQSWENVVEIACGDYATFARFADGTVAAVGYLTYQLDGWRNTTALAAGSYQVCALQASGSLYASHESARQGNLTGLIDMDCHAGGVVGITRDGHVAASFAAMPEWDNMIDLSMGSAMILGIRADGTVAVHRYYASAAPGVETVENAVAVAAGGAHCAVLDADGRVHAFGTNESGQCDTEDWDLK